MPLARHQSSATSAEPAAEAGIASLLADLANASASIRRGAARDLAGHPDAALALCRAAESELDESAREAMFTALIRIGTAAAAAGLMPLLASEDPGLRNAAVEALRTMPDGVAEHIGTLLAGERDVRIFAVDILAALAHPETTRWLVGIIATDADVNVRAGAVAALAEHRDPAAVEPLRALLARSEDEPFLAFAINDAIERCAGDA